MRVRWMILAAILCVTGCGESKPQANGGKDQKATKHPTNELKHEHTAAKNDSPKDSFQSSFEQINSINTAVPDRLHQPFDSALAQESGKPAPKIANGLSTAKVFDLVRKHWPEIRFRTPEGTRIDYTVTMETDLGTMVMKMMPDAAPNHVRSFLALAQAGYYDGLGFETRIGDQSANSPRAVAAGSPLMDGNDIITVGYWLQHEILDSEMAKKQGISHQPGTVAAIHAIGDLNTSCCRFYVCLNEAQQLDGEFTIFAKVTEGLEVAEKIFNSPCVADEVSPRPFAKPIMIRKVTVRSE